MLADSLLFSLLTASLALLTCFGLGLTFSFCPRQLSIHCRASFALASGVVLFSEGAPFACSHMSKTSRQAKVLRKHNCARGRKFTLAAIANEVEHGAEQSKTLITLQPQTEFLYALVHVAFAMQYRL